MTASAYMCRDALEQKDILTNRLCNSFSLVVKQ